MSKRLKAEIQKPKIIEAFYRTILEEGFEGASIAKIAARIDMTPTLIIHYFGTKENMTMALVDYVLDLYSKMLVSAQTRETDPHRRLQKLLKIFWSRPYYEKINIASDFSVISASFRNTRINRKIKILYEQMRAFLTKNLEALKESGVIGVTDVPATVDVMISMIEGSRHFKHFFVKPKDLEHYNQRMIQAALAVLEYKGPPVSINQNKSELETISI